MSYNLENGIGISKDQKKALYYAELDNDQDYSYRLNYISFYYSQGIGVKKNHEKAFELYKLSAEQGDKVG